MAVNYAFEEDLLGNTTTQTESLRYNLLLSARGIHELSEN